MERVYPQTSLRTDNRFGTDGRKSRGTGSVVSKFGFVFGRRLPKWHYYGIGTPQNRKVDRNLPIITALKEKLA